VKTLLFLLIFSVSLFSKVEIHFSHTSVKHGTTFAVVFQNDTNMSHAPNIIFKNKSYQMFTINGSIKKYRVFLPVDYYNKLQNENVQVSYRIKDKIIKKNFEITIVDGNYKQNEIIKVLKSKVTLSSKDKKRSEKEYNTVFKNVYSQITPYDLTHNHPFQAPLKSKITSNYGNARIYNGKTKSYHTGTDFRAKVGTNIYSSNNGIVALTMKRFYLGNVVYIDHGRGAFSYYSHMGSFNVKEGQKIKSGDVIGKSGKTGRITGPHLHYAFRLYNVTVDPLQYTELYNKILKLYP
jgi:murein DD-endopeptidase MepM/ murein hydrolase activator NlpD